MKKVLFVINTLGLAGAEVSLIEVLKRFDKRDTRLSLLVLIPQGELFERLPEDVELINKGYDPSSVHDKKGLRRLALKIIKRSLRGLSLLRLLPYMAGGLMRMLKRGHILPDKLLWRLVADTAPRTDEEYDMAVAFLEGAATYYVADYVRAAIKVGFIHVDYELAGYERALDGDCYLGYDSIFSVSGEVSDSFCRVYPECADRVGVFHNMLDAEDIRARAKEPGGFLDGYDGLRILSVGRLTRQKGFELSVRAMAALKESGIRARWYVLGEGDKRGYLENLIDELGLLEDFVLLGAVENPYNYIKQCDLFVHVTRYEGKSIAVQEARILGKPIIISGTSGNLDQIEDGIDGVVCEFTPQSLTAKLRWLLLDDSSREILGRNALLMCTTASQECRKLERLLTERDRIAGER